MEEARNYYSADEQSTIAGAYASAPPANLYEVARNIDGSDLSGAIGFAMNGMVERYDGCDELLDKYLSEDGKKVLETFKNSCTNEITSEPYAYMTTRDWTKDGRSLEEILKEPDMAPALDKMKEQEIGNSSPVAPVMVISGRYDRQVEYQQARNLAMKYCTIDGAKVVYRDDVVPEIEDGLKNHLIQALSGPTFGFRFMIDRFNDKLAGDQVCANFNGNDDTYGSGVAMSSPLSSLPLSSKLVPDNAPESGPSSGVDGSGIRSPEGILARIIIAVLGIVGFGVGAAWPALSQMLKF
ncbi:lipase family protein [Corynebacterium sp. CCUG 71335]|uniref:lipase family protein n=1 Tax=Corynebacterium sp. CCUG 71335 TaxID=2823892 RepID=UPI00351F1092